MLSLIASPNRLPLSPLSVPRLNPPSIPSLVLTINRSRARTRTRRTPRRGAAPCCHLVAAEEGGSLLGLVDSKRRPYESSWCCSCKGGWEGEGEGDSALEAEVLDFMTNSEKPGVFPTKRELVAAGRVDLAEAISKKGGWLSLGWDLDEHGEQEIVEEDDIQRAVGSTNGAVSCSDVENVQKRAQSFPERNALDAADVGSFGFSAVSSNSSQSVSSSGRSLTIGNGKDTGIDGILNRLEKQRNLSFGINLGGNGYSAHASKNGGDESRSKTSIDVDSADLERSRKHSSGSPSEDISSHFDGKIGHKIALLDSDNLTTTIEPETWRTWSIQWAGSPDTKESEAAEISFNENEMSGKEDSSRDGIHKIRESATDTLDIRKVVNHSHIKSRIQHLELELSSALRLLQSKSVESISKEGHDSNSGDLRKLSDAWEFQENEVMNAKNRLRSLRAKLAVLEGKMALAIIDAQKLAEEKQKKIDGARRALQILRTACIVWPNSASKVLLVGSFDGWTTQRKMEKSNTGIFSVCLKLYPGRYEIKFIVDGIWRIDPLRPIVRNNGHENNLLIIT